MTRVIKVCLELFLFFSLTLSAKAEEGAFGRILEILHGKSISVVATPQACGEPPPANNDVEAGLHWRKGAGKCEFQYKPKLTSLFSPISHNGEVSQFIYDDDLYTEMLEAFDELEATLTHNELDVLNKLDVQMTFWEFIPNLEQNIGLKVDWRPEVDEQRINILLSRAHKLLSLVLFTNDDLLNLEKLAFQSQSLLLGDNLLGLKDSCSYEFTKVAPLHWSASSGRLYPRIFIGTDRNNCNALQRLVDKGERHKLIKAPELIPKIRTVLLAYFNIMKDDYTVVTSDLLFSVREVQYLDLFDKNMNIDEKFNLFDIRQIDYQKALNLEKKPLSSRYLEIDSNQLVRSNFLDVNPIESLDGVALATTNRANCFSCHQGRIKNLDVRGQYDRVRLTKPFSSNLGVEFIQNVLNQKTIEAWSKRLN